MFGNIDMNALSGMMDQLSQQAKASQEEANKKIMTSKSGGGMVSVSANGSGEIVDLSIDDSLMEDKESLQILLISALNDLIKNIEEEKKHQALSMLGGFNPFSHTK